MIKLKVSQIDRLDKYIANHTDITRSKTKTLIDKGLVLVNGLIYKSSHILSLNDLVEITKEPQKEEIDLSKIYEPLEIIYQDEYLAAIIKRKGIVVHPSETTKDYTLVNVLKYHFDKLSNLNGDLRPGIVHRLDKETAGLLLIAKDNETHSKLAFDFKNRQIRKFYLALVHGNIKNDFITIENLIGRDKKDRKKMSVVSDGKSAISKLKVIERYNNYSLVEFEIITGRTHQIRVHAKSINHPIVGDSVYGPKNNLKVNSQLLFAYKLIFKHPQTGEILELVAKMPDYFTNTIEKIKKC